MFLFLFANGQSPLQKKIDFSIKRKPLKASLQKLSLTSEVNIAFSSNFFDKKNRVSIDAKNETLEYILQELLKDANVTFTASGNQIILSKTKKVNPKSFTISGYLADKDSGERLIGAHIYAPEYEKGTASNEYGFYSLTLPEGTTIINFSYLGAEEMTKSIDLTSNLRKDLSLASSVELAEIVVRDTILFSSDVASNPLKDNSKSLRQYKKMTINDPLQQIGLLAGVSSGTDAFGGLYVRGGNQDQNLLLIDGVPIFNPSHLLGITSIFNNSNIRNAKFYKGGIPARYGGRTSSVFDVRTKDGNLKHYEGEFSTNILSSSISIEGPIKKDKISFYFSFKRSQLELIPEQFVSLEFNNATNTWYPNFFDLNTKLNYNISPKDKIQVSFYGGNDVIGVRFSLSEYKENFDFTNKSLTFDSDWGNIIFALKWNHLFNSKLFSNITVTNSKFDFEFYSFQDETSFIQDTFVLGASSFGQYKSLVNESTFKIDFDYTYSTKHKMRFGTATTFTLFQQSIQNIGEVSFSDSTTIDVNELLNASTVWENHNSFEWSSYFEDQIKWTNKFSTNIGIRASLYNSEKRKTALYVEPRLVAKYSLRQHLSLNASVTRNTQFLHLLSSGISLPTDIWLPSINELAPQISWQSTLGLNYQQEGTSILLEGFYKTMDNMIENQGTLFDEGLSNFELTDSSYISGNGKSYGVEFSLEKKYNKVFSFFNYTISKSERLFSSRNLGNNFPFQYDRRHAINMGFNWKITPKIDLSFNWSFHTGTPRLFLNQFFRADKANVELFNPSDNYHATRTPNYHRLDGSVRFIFPKRRSSHILKLGAFNIYNRENTSFYIIENQEDNGTTTPVLNPISLSFFIPQIIYTVNFDFSKKKKKRNRGN